MRRFRMPSCIGQPARYGIADGTPPPEMVRGDGRFRDRTLAWFSTGEESARDECALFDAARAAARRRVLVPIIVGLTAFGVGALIALLAL